MKTFTATFSGREAGAIGIFTEHKITITAKNTEAARIAESTDAKRSVR